MLICIRVFFDVAMTPERKAEKRQADADRQRRKRERDKAVLSRRDAEPVSRPPVPVPDPELRINDHVIASKEPEPTSTASPSEPSDLVSWLREELERRRAACRMPCKWKPEHREHLGDVALKASNSQETPSGSCRQPSTPSLRTPAKQNTGTHRQGSLTVSTPTPPRLWSRRRKP